MLWKQDDGVINILLRLFPHTRLSDHAVNYIRFVSKHRRRPTDALVLNDVLYRIKTNGELRNPLRVFTTDKEFMKLYVSALIGPDYNAPTLAVLRSRQEVQDYAFPDRCIAKPTHSSGRYQTVAAGDRVDRLEICSWFSHDYYRGSREENYRTLSKKVIVEPLLFEGLRLRKSRSIATGARRTCAIYAARRAMKSSSISTTGTGQGLPMTPRRQRRARNTHGQRVFNRSWTPQKRSAAASILYTSISTPTAKGSMSARSPIAKAADITDSTRSETRIWWRKNEFRRLSFADAARVAGVVGEVGTTGGGDGTAVEPSPPAKLLILLNTATWDRCQRCISAAPYSSPCSCNISSTFRSDRWIRT